MTRSPGRSGHRWRQLRELIKARDKVCYLCGHPIDPDLPYPDPGSFTVDHKIPLSERPDLATNWENLRGAHHRCNTSRGNRPINTINRTSRQW